MKCRKCGNEVEIGEIYCQKCGTAIQIVPEYNPLEDEIEAVLDHEKSKKEKNEKEERKRQKERMQRKLRIQRAILIACMALVVLVIGGGIFAFVKYKEVNSFDYQYALGNQYLQKEEYGAALECYTRALEYDKNSIEVRMKAGEIHSILGNYNRAVELLLEVVNLEPTIKNYELLMEACELAGNTELMNKILRENQGNAIGNGLSKYRVEKITVNIPGGNHKDYLTLILTSPQRDVAIYYTLDGKAPTRNSTLYTEPIQLDSMGTYILRAVAYNEANLAGEELNETYIIELVVPDAPAISPGSGSYTYGEKIEIEVPEGATGYFTVDGTVPTRESAYIYTDPIEMPIGNTVFSAIVVDKYGITSGVTKRNYTCTINRPFGYDAAVIKLKNYLVEVGMMTDLSGNRGSGEKILVEFKALSTIQETECYVFTLRRTAAGETFALNDKIYAVTTQSGEVYPLKQEGEGNYSLAVPVTDNPQ